MHIFKLRIDIHRITDTHRMTLNGWLTLHLLKEPLQRQQTEIKEPLQRQQTKISQLLATLSDSRVFKPNF